MYCLSVKRDPITPCMLPIFHIIFESVHQQAEHQLPDPLVTPNPKAPVYPSPLRPSTMVQDGLGHATLEHRTPETQDGRSHNLACPRPPTILAPTTFSFTMNQPPDITPSTADHAPSINHSTSTLGHTSGTLPQKFTILDQSPSSSPLDKMAAPFISPSGSQPAPMVKDNKPCCHPVTNNQSHCSEFPFSIGRGFKFPRY